MKQQIIFGAPGCGKTHYLMDILEKELKTNEPDKIAFVSFTRKGTYEGMARASELFGYSKKDLKYFRTLHSIAFSEGGFKKSDMISKSDYKRFSEKMGMNFTGYYTEDFFHNDDMYLFYEILKRNNEKIAIKNYDNDIDIITANNVAHNYKRYKDQMNVVDFTDIIELFIEKNEALNVDIAIIDEAQDLTSLQWKMCKVAFRNCKKVYIAGDDDQAIYEWSGADINHFLSLKGERVILNKSYRLNKNILNFSKNISKCIGKRVDKIFEPHKSNEGDIYFYNGIDELKINNDQTYYFLARNNYFLNKHRAFLRKNYYIFLDKGNLSVDKRDIEAINIFERMRKNRTMSDSEEIKLKYYLKEKIDLRLPWYVNLNIPKNKIDYYRDIIRNKIKTSIEPKIEVNTIHGVKGGEKENVVLILDFTKSIANNFDLNYDAEMRCLYVACTRAKLNLHIVHSTSKYGYEDYFNFKGGSTKCTKKKKLIYMET